MTQPRLRFPCPACGEPVNVPRVHAGQRGLCHSCRAVIPIPALEVACAPSPPLGLVDPHTLELVAARPAEAQPSLEVVEIVDEGGLELVDAPAQRTPRGPARRRRLRGSSSGRAPALSRGRSSSGVQRASSSPRNRSGGGLLKGSLGVLSSCGGIVLLLVGVGVASSLWTTSLEEAGRERVASWSFEHPAQRGFAMWLAEQAHTEALSDAKLAAGGGSGRRRGGAGLFPSRSAYLDSLEFMVRGAMQEPVFVNAYCWELVSHDQKPKEALWLMESCLVEALLTLGPEEQAHFFDTLALALHRNGRTEEALGYQSRAMELLPASVEQSLRDEYQGRWELYREHLR
jgi:hypothetical protein